MTCHSPLCRVPPSGDRRIAADPPSARRASARSFSVEGLSFGKTREGSRRAAVVNSVKSDRPRTNPRGTGTRCMRKRANPAARGPISPTSGSPTPVPSNQTIWAVTLSGYHPDPRRGQGLSEELVHRRLVGGRELVPRELSRRDPSYVFHPQRVGLPIQREPARIQGQMDVV